MVSTPGRVFLDWIDNVTGARTADYRSCRLHSLNADAAKGLQKWSSVALDADGDFAISWTSSADNTDITNDVYARRYKNDGTTVGNSFVVNTTTDNTQQLSSTAMDADGDFVITWESYQEHGDGTSLGAADSWGIYAQRYVANDKMGTLSYLGPHGENGSEYRINTTVRNDQRLPNVVMTATGDTFFSWQSDESGSEGVYTRSYYQAVDDAGPVVVRVTCSYTEEDEKPAQSPW